MDHPIRCRCGEVQGHLRGGASTARAICYCRYCQAWATYLQRDREVLDADGGSDIVATTPDAVTFTSGRDRLACVVLSRRGPYRWYASCCRAPIGNTSRSPGLPYVGLLHTALDTAPLTASFGPARTRVNTGSARRPVASTPVRTALVVARLARAVLWARLRRSARSNPFFDADGAPVAAPDELGADERRALLGERT